MGMGRSILLKLKGAEVYVLPWEGGLMASDKEMARKSDPQMFKTRHEMKSDFIRRPSSFSFNEVKILSGL